jgi:hypothetical protein
MLDDTLDGINSRKAPICIEKGASRQIASKRPSSSEITGSNGVSTSVIKFAARSDV